MSSTSATTQPTELPKQYQHAETESRWYAYWLQKGYFHSDPDDRKRPFTIVIPPPNVTGALHLGHALNNTLQDVVIRFKRMQDYNALWMPGTDHAGIATQAVVERRLLEEEKLSRHDLGREKLVERIWAWKQQYEKRIIGQLQRMGCSCDWQRTRFTLDDVCARAVRHTFFELFRKGLIYRGKRLVNWDTFLQTAVSDDEVFHETVSGNFWHIRYRVIDAKAGEPEFVTVATTRPETMLGDTAVAVHPDPAAALKKVEAQLREKLAAAPAKERPQIEKELESLQRRRGEMLPALQKLRDMAQAGRQVMLPLMERPIPLVCDEWAKPELGSGCVKITPAHDANDYEVWQRRPEIGAVNILNSDGTLNASAGAYQGLTVKKAREAVVAALEEQGLLAEVEAREIELAHSDRSKTPIEPYLADQWFVKMDQLAQSAMDAVTSERVKIIPERYGKTYLDWLSEKRDWCISRNLWWGHRIPVWHVRLTGNQDAWQRLTAAGVEPREAFDLADQEVAEAFRQSFQQFAEAFEVNDDLAIQIDSEDLKCRICARTEAAEKALYALFNSRHLLGSPGSPPKRKYPDYPLDPPVEPKQTAIQALKKLFREDVQDADVLDTWFSSALWPHSTLGWPGPALQPNDADWQLMKHYYPTSVLITSRDIITLWVARMVLTGLHNVGDVPFREVFIHPKILDGYGETMSKSKGNGVDPLDVLDKFGADAMRFALAHLTTETQDVRMPVEFECPHCGKLLEQTKKNRVLPRIDCPQCKQPFSTQWASKADDVKLPRGAVVSDRFELSRNFCNKLWNAARFTLMNLEGYQGATVDEAQLAVEDRWILSRLATVTAQVTEALEHYRYADAMRSLYEFAWDEFCSFYVEMVKARLQSEASRALAQRVLAHTLDTLLRLLHPAVPFITEEIWQRLGELAPQRGLEPQRAAASVMIAPWPRANEAHRDATIEERFAHFQELLRGLRDIRARQNVPPKTAMRFSVRSSQAIVQLLEPLRPYFASMAGAECTAWGPQTEPPATNATVKLSFGELYVDLSELIDVEAELARNEKEREKLLKFVQGKQAKLTNESFVSRAPADVVERERESLVEAEHRLAAIEAALAELRTRR